MAQGVFPWLELLTQFSFEKQPIFGTVSKIALFKLKTKHTSYWTHLARRWWSWWPFKSMDILHSPFEYCPANLDGGSLLLLKIGQKPNLTIWKLLKCPSTPNSPASSQRLLHLGYSEKYSQCTWVTQGDNSAPLRLWLLAGLKQKKRHRLIKHHRHLS